MKILKLVFWKYLSFKDFILHRSHFSTFGDIYRIHLEDEEPVSPGDKLKGFYIFCDNLIFDLAKFIARSLPVLVNSNTFLNRID